MGVSRWSSKIAMLACALSLAGCATLIQATEASAEKDRAARYMTVSGAMVIDELQQVGPYTACHKPAPDAAAYEGMQLIRLLGLTERLTVRDQYRFVKAVLTDIPKDNMAGRGIRNVIFPAWFEEGAPLVVSVTTAYTVAQNPVVVALFNAPGDIRTAGAAQVRKLKPTADYPGFDHDGRTMRLRSGSDSYAFQVLADNRVTALSYSALPLPAFPKGGDPLDRVSLTDRYLRDADRKNDDAVVPVLQEIIDDESMEPAVRLGARAQMFMYDLFRPDYDAAERRMNEIKECGLLSDPVIDGSEFLQVVTIDMPNMLVIARVLSTGDESLLPSAQ